MAERARIAQAAADRTASGCWRTPAAKSTCSCGIARRALIEHGAQLAVDVAQTRIVRTITPEDQLRLVDRYAAQLREAR